jgi:hypothetical protein
MKTLLLTFFFFISISVISQEVILKRISPNEFSFSHSESMDQNRINRYKSRMIVDCTELDSINFLNQECNFILKEHITQTDFDRAIIYCITKFGYKTYIIEE